MGGIRDLKRRHNGARVTMLLRRCARATKHSFRTCSTLAPSAGYDVESTEVQVTRHGTHAPDRTVPDVTNDSNATRWVDQLLERTRHIMTRIPGDDSSTVAILPHHRWHHTIAFSGGVDSTLVAALVHRCSLDLNRTATASQPFVPHVVQCVMGVSEAVPVEQIAMAESIAAAIGVPFQTVPTEEGRIETYIENNGRACFACKTELYSTLKAVAQHASQHHDNDSRTVVLYNGTNADDLLDPTRLGLVAAANFTVQSPVAILSKEQVRWAARHLGLPNWNTAASPCLRSRLALGVRATTEHLQRIAQAERFVRTELGHAKLPPSTNVRVRLLAQQKARLEVDVGFALDTVVQMYQAHQHKWEHTFRTELGFASLTIAPFKSGSVATPVMES